MIKTLKKDCRRRIAFSRQEILLRVMNLLNKSAFYKKTYAQQRKTLQNNYCLAIKTNSFCIITGRRRGIVSQFKVSRIILKEFVFSNVFLMLKKW